MAKYLVTCKIPYVHQTVVAVEALDPELALTACEQALDLNELWDDTEETTFISSGLLQDPSMNTDWEVKEVDEFPVSDKEFDDGPDTDVERSLGSDRSPRP